MGVPKAVAGLITAGGTGTLNLDFDENYCHAPQTVTGFSGTYGVASNGRTTIALGGYALVAYLASANQAFLFVSDINVLFGLGEPQTDAPFTNGIAKGTTPAWARIQPPLELPFFSADFTATAA